MNNINQKIVQFSSNNEEIFTEEEKNGIINMFPENIREYLLPLNNPLDQTQVILSLLKDKNIKLILQKTIDEFGDDENNPLFCASDFARMIKSAEKNINRWKKWLTTEDYVVYNKIKNELLSKGGDKILCSFDPKITNIHGETIFLTMEGLKKVLSNVEVEGAHIYRTWINNLATIMKKLIKWIHKIKTKIELDKHTIEINELKNQLQIKQMETTKRIELSIQLFPKTQRTNGNIYAISSNDKLKKCAIKFGNTSRDVKIRNSTLKTADPDLFIIHSVEVLDINMAENIIHYFLDNLRYDREFFYVSSEDIAKKILETVAIFVNDMIIKYDNDYETIREKYIREEIINDVNIRTKRSRSRSPANKMTKIIKNKEQYNVFDIFADDSTNFEITNDKEIYTTNNKNNEVNDEIKNKINSKYKNINSKEIDIETLLSARSIKTNKINKDITKWNKKCDVFENFLKDNEYLINYGFYIDHGFKTPSPVSNNIEEKKIGLWFSQHRRLYNSNDGIMMEPEVMERWKLIIKKYPNCFLSQRENWIQKRNLLILFMKYHERTPSKYTKDTNEKMLEKWLQHQKENYKKCTQIMKDESIRKLYEQLLQDIQHPDFFKNKKEI